MSDALYDGSIRTHSVVDAGSFIEALFPVETIFGHGAEQNKISDFWKDFTVNHPVAWRELLDGLCKPGSESHLAAFLNSLSQHRRGSSNLPRLWSASFKDKPAAGDATRKPDLVCFSHIHGAGASDWSQFASVGELKSGNFSDVYELLVGRAAALLRNQDARRFVLTFVIAKHSLTVALFDRGGSIVSRAFDISEEHSLFLQFVLGLTFAPLASLGYDTTVTTYRIGRALSSKYIPNVHILCILHVAERIHGRGTVVWLAKLKGIPDREIPDWIKQHFGERWSIDPVIIVKDLWMDENASLTEGMILALLKWKGVQGVPRILAEERVCSVPALDETSVDVLAGAKPVDIPAGASPDSTALIRSRLNLPLFKLGSKVLDSTARHATQIPFNGFEPRAHIRSYTTPWAIPIFQFRSGVELLGVIVDTLTSHQQAASSYYVKEPQEPFPFRFLHRDPSLLNIGMVPSCNSDFPACQLRSKNEHRGCLYDWGFAKVAEVECHKGFQHMDEQTSEEDSTMEEVRSSSDTDNGPRSTIYIAHERHVDSGLFTATPDIINDFETLVVLVRRCIREESVVLEITGTRPFMAIELLVASLVHTGKNHPWREAYQGVMHSVRHDLEAFYMVLLSICLLYERPHIRKGLDDYSKPGAPLLPEEDVLPLCAVLWLSGQEEPNLSNIRLRYLGLCTSGGFDTMVVPHLSRYFSPMAPYLQRIRASLYGKSVWSRGPYPQPGTHPDYETFQRILLEAMKTIPSTPGYEDFSKVMEPPETLYCPISTEGQWQGKAWSSEISFPMRSNNAFGFVETQVLSAVPSQPVTPTAYSAASTIEGYVQVHMGPLGPTSSRRPTLKTNGLRASARYALVPEVERATSRHIRKIRGTSVIGDKPYRPFIPSNLFHRRQKWLKKKVLT